MRILFDTNVLLDALLARAPHQQGAVRLLDAVETGRLEGCLAATTLTTLAYFLERAYGPTQTRDDLAHLLRRFEVLPVTRQTIEAALGAGWKDFEDAVLHEAARLAGADGLVTRNAPDFRAATLSVYTPAELLAALA
ncbi:MAG: PIN domain-containing protein [Bacteroidetes bacterium]|nr:MAG: PIN domain-containing protein [Bacteroidota bacterium]